MQGKNKHGLSRYIPEDVKREVRQRCGFGCVICGFGFYDYEHFNPDFVDARVHDPSGMTLLCSQCNQKRARGRLSAHTVEMANRNPKCRQEGFANELFDFHHEPIRIKFAGVEFYNCEHLIVINDQPILSVQPSEEQNGPMLLSGIFCNSIGQESLRIDKNEWQAKTDNWDVECVGPRITIRSASKEISLVIRMEVPDGLVIERLDMMFDGFRLIGDQNVLKVSFNGGKWNEYRTCSMAHCYAGLVLESALKSANDSSLPHF